MSRPSRRVKERGPRGVKMARFLIGAIWGLAFLFFVTNGGATFFPPGLSDPFGVTPWVLMALNIVLLCALVVAVLKTQIATARSMSELRAMSPDGFEDWVAARFRGLGYSVKMAGCRGDHDVDLIAEKEGELAVIQCRNYLVRSVGEPALQDLYGAMYDFGADRAYMVTTGRMTQAAAMWAEGRSIEIWDGNRVARLWSQMAASRTAASSAQLQATASAPDTNSQPVAAPAEPVCSKCGSVLIERRNRATGEPFLGCPGYPACRHTQPLATLQ